MTGFQNDQPDAVVQAVWRGTQVFNGYAVAVVRRKDLQVRICFIREEGYSHPVHRIFQGRGGTPGMELRQKAMIHCIGTQTRPGRKTIEGGSFSCGHQFFIKSQVFPGIE